MKTINDLIKRLEELESIKDNSGGTFCTVFNCSMEHEYNTLKHRLSMWEDEDNGTIEWRNRRYVYAEFNDWEQENGNN